MLSQDGHRKRLPLAESRYKRLPLDGAASYKRLPLDGAASYKRLPLDGAASYKRLPLDGAATGAAEGRRQSLLPSWASHRRWRGVQKVTRSATIFIFLDIEQIFYFPLDNRRGLWYYASCRTKVQN